MYHWFVNNWWFKLGQFKLYFFHEYTLHNSTLVHEYDHETICIRLKPVHTDTKISSIINKRVQYKKFRKLFPQFKN
jgi:hypothetical protein